MLFQSSTREQTIFSRSALDPLFSAWRELRSSGNEAPRLWSAGSFASLASLWEDSVRDNIDEEYDRLVVHLHDCAKRAESLKDVKKRLPSKTLKLIRQSGIARAAGNNQLTSELARQCREAIKEDLSERRAAVSAEAAEAGKSICKARRSFVNCKTKMTFYCRPNGTVTASRRALERVIYDFRSDLFDSHVCMPIYHLRQDGYVVPSVPQRIPARVRIATDGHVDFVAFLRISVGNT
ncbi:hypothetical protein V3C99_011960 [Haemonchus contortus]